MSTVNRLAIKNRFPFLYSPSPVLKASWYIRSLQRLPTYLLPQKCLSTTSRIPRIICLYIHIFFYLTHSFARIFFFLVNTRVDFEETHRWCDISVDPTSSVTHNLRISLQSWCIEAWRAVVSNFGLGCCSSLCRCARSLSTSRTFFRVSLYSFAVLSVRQNTHTHTHVAFFVIRVSCARGLGRKKN